MNATDISKLKRDAPELYDAVINQGVLIERRRVLAHLNVAKLYDSLPEAVEAVAAGTPAKLTPGEALPYTLLHNRYASIEDKRDGFASVAAS
ncbi:MAG: hypothetical protein COA54_04285 [Thiotrichaceae bacterium]|nr:MAG: hypothetical protein COA54_04285 [Thiotrichaceae bacterium]